MSKEYYRKQINNLKKNIIDLREDKKKRADKKRRDLDSLTKRIKYANTSSQKASYRKRKIDVRENYKRDIERIKDKIERIKDKVSNLRERIKRLWLYYSKKYNHVETSRNTTIKRSRHY